MKTYIRRQQHKKITPRHKTKSTTTERDLMDTLNHNNQADVTEALNSTSRYLNDLLNIGNP